MTMSRTGGALVRRSRRAVIIGGSMSGLFSAAFLRQIGWDVDVYERSKVELVGRGAGITGHPELLQALEASGAGTERLGIEVAKRIAIDREGRITDERPLRQILTSWDRLQRLLRATIAPAHFHVGWNFLTPGKRRFNFIWYRVADAARLREMANGVQHEYSVPPPLIRKDLIAEM